MDCHFLDEFGILFRNMIVGFVLGNPDFEVILAVADWRRFVVNLFV